MFDVDLRLKWFQYLGRIFFEIPFCIKKGIVTSCIRHGKLTYSNLQSCTTWNIISYVIKREWELFSLRRG